MNDWVILYIVGGCTAKLYCICVYVCVWMGMRECVGALNLLSKLFLCLSAHLNYSYSEMKWVCTCKETVHDCTHTRTHTTHTERDIHTHTYALTCPPPTNTHTTHHPCTHTHTRISIICDQMTSAGPLQPGQFDTPKHPMSLHGGSEPYIKGRLKVRSLMHDR